MKQSVLVVGGDKRYYIAADLIAENGHNVFACGFEKLPASARLKNADPKDLPYTDYVLLPAPYEDAEGRIRMPHAETALCLEEVLGQINPDACMLLGGVDMKAQALFDRFGIAYLDLLLDETYTVRNAFLTSQAAVMVAATKSSRALSDCGVLILGYGRIGKTLAALLKPYGCRIAVMARKTKDLEWIAVNGLEPVPPEKLTEGLGGRDIIFNTVPYPLLGSAELAGVKKDALLLELASKPYGVDLAEAKRLGLAASVEGGLPGKCFPHSAAIAVADAFQRIVHEGW